MAEVIKSLRKPRNCCSEDIKPAVLSYADNWTDSGRAKYIYAKGEDDQAATIRKNPTVQERSRKNFCRSF